MSHYSTPSPSSITSATTSAPQAPRYTPYFPMRPYKPATLSPPSQSSAQTTSSVASTSTSTLASTAVTSDYEPKAKRLRLGPSHIGKGGPPPDKTSSMHYPAFVQSRSTSQPRASPGQTETIAEKWERRQRGMEANMTSEEIQFSNLIGRFGVSGIVGGGSIGSASVNVS